MSLRPYQREALAALDDGWHNNGLKRLGVALPTGTGKTHVMAELAVTGAVDGHHWPGGVLVLVHRDTLVEQTERRFREHAQGSGVTVGVVKAARNVVAAHIVVASIHTLRSVARLEQLRTPSLIIVDEAHVSMSDTYARVFARFPNLRVAGFSATWVRSDSRNLGDFWQAIVYERGIRWAIREGFLVPPVGISVGMPDGVLDNVRVSRATGDYNEKDLGEAVTVNELRDNVVRGYQTHATGRSAVLFAPTQHAAEFFRAGLMAAGIPSAGIYATTPARARQEIFGAYRRRQIAVLTTCTALAEGWDEPQCSAALMVRPTKHAGLYIQQVGRVLRPWPGKTDALVLDFVAGTNTLDLRAALAMSEPKPDKTEDDEDETLEGDEYEPSDNESVFVIHKGTKRVDLFAGTDAQWLVTDHGVPFVQTATAFYFIVEVGGAWNVGTCPHAGLKGGRWLREGLSPDDALSYASIVAIDDDATSASSEANWRKRGARLKPTESQIRYCRSLGIVFTEQDTKATISDKISVRKASAALAPLASAGSVTA